MSGRWITSLIILGGLILVSAAVWFRQSSRPAWPVATKTSHPIDPRPAPAAAPDFVDAVDHVVRPEPSRARTAFDRLLAALRSGDKAKIREVLEAVRLELVPPPVPDEENAAVLYKKAFEKHVGETDDTDVDILGRLSEGKEITPAERAKLQSYLDKNRETLALLHEAAQRPRCNFGLDYSQGSATELPHISPLILAVRLLNVEAMIEGKGRAAEIARASTRLSDAVAEEPVLVSQLVRGILHGISSEALQKEFEGDIPRGRLQSLLGLPPDRVREGYEKVLLFELYSGVKFVLDGGDPKTLGVEGRSIRRPDDPLTAHDLEHFAQTLADFTALAGRPYYEVRDDLERLRLAKVDSAPWYAELTKLMLPNFDKAQQRQAVTEAYLGTAQVAAALRSYRDARGSYPPSLDEVREVLPRMPLDPFTGKPYLYRREGAGFVVYSAGVNRVDSGGVGGATGEEAIIFRSPR